MDSLNVITKSEFKKVCFQIQKVRCGNTCVEFYRILIYSIGHHSISYSEKKDPVNFLFSVVRNQGKQL